MFIALGRALREWTSDDPVYEAHKTYVTALVEEGAFLCTGPQVGGGSVIVGYGDDREAFRQLINDDPFSKAEYVEFTIHQFQPGLVDRRLQHIITTNK